MTALETYLKELRDIRFSGGGVNETSYYGALANLLNDARCGDCIASMIHVVI